MRHANKIFGAFAVALLLVVYGGAYLALVERRATFDSPQAVAEYKLRGSFASAFFLPANAFDRLLRPKYWTVGGRAADPYDVETFTK